MSYINAEKVLPAWLVKKIRGYVGDGLLYIPPDKSSRKKWGSNSGARQIFEARNNEIRMKKSAGATILQLAEKYHLSEDTIKRILYK
ncbi:MAG: hypothetical protein J1E35_10875 [Lachnospiraceae bacterium]|nr:hypothetical protein [Lachnospiraceae bacterium]